MVRQEPHPAGHQPEIPANHATALIGPSGCGKSTFVRCLNRMHETNPDRARRPARARSAKSISTPRPRRSKIRRRIGMVFQRPNPFPTMSIYDNVAAGLKLNGFRNRQRAGRNGGALAAAMRRCGMK